MWVSAFVTGGVFRGVPNYNLNVTISDFSLEQRAAIALKAFLSNVAAKQQRQDLNKAKQQSVPKL